MQYCALLPRKVSDCLIIDLVDMRYLHVWGLIPALVVPGVSSYLSAREVKTEGVLPMLKHLKNFTRALRLPTTADREAAYLNGSVDRIDLEYRQRQIDRGLFRKYY